MPRPKVHDEALRARLLDRAAETLSTDGPDGLSLRKLAADAGTSTTAVYSLFGGKPALLRELYLEAFRRFGERLSTVENSGNPVEDLVRLGLAYRESARADPHLYAIMFSTVVPGFEPDQEAIRQAVATLRPLMDMVAAGIASGHFAGYRAEEIAVGSWGLVHGLVSLEVRGHLPPGIDVTANFETVLRAQARGWCTAPE
ncbi:TetR/AcrR family transcriptional regulator [Allokutzneria albata]|uniref:DNA-binding transcriptional regulator, AcrR family n=1 Tax=Allokutzneria albata TaxID=211114 RepID=A0A1H0B932_ALLAB|nr:TetR/AcrR family transcriptional regulator [Allokutzneria albata]SDN42121.1 DNA-binding transcriptional regulator, AcrR family [Allokutzneria albata]